MPDEWQARQATPAILQVSSSKHNVKKITTRVRGLFHQSITAILTEEKREEKQFTKPTHVAVCVCACVRACVCVCTAWCSEIGSLASQDAPECHASSDVGEPISLHQAVCVCVCQRKTKDRADGMREKKCPLPSTGFEPVSLGYAPIVLPIAPRRQARLASVE